jgi:hypothetical protein
MKTMQRKLVIGVAVATVFLVGAALLAILYETKRERKLIEEYMDKFDSVYINSSRGDMSQRIADLKAAYKGKLQGLPDEMQEKLAAWEASAAMCHVYPRSMDPRGRYCSKARRLRREILGDEVKKSTRQP